VGRRADMLGKEYGCAEKLYDMIWLGWSFQSDQNNSIMMCASLIFALKHEAVLAYHNSIKDINHLAVIITVQIRIAFLQPHFFLDRLLCWCVVLLLWIEAFTDLLLKVFGDGYLQNVASFRRYEPGQTKHHS
jgi:hypothetical protein